MKLSDNTILITGGASGIGLAFANLLHDNNKIIVCGRDKARLEKLKNRLPEIATYQCDLANEADLSRFADTVLANHPSLNMLINNAGIQYNYLFTEEQPHAGFVTEEVRVNLLAPIQLTERLLPNLMRQDDAAVVNITSALAIAPKKCAAVYSATKSAMRSFTQALRYQLEGSHVAVFELVPPLVDTDMTTGRGDGKITPQALASEALKAIASDKHDVLIGKTKILYLLYRLLPSAAYRLLKNS
ncbi:MAG: SDR family oxidoreductase [Gammaproteobacteria bacterium]|nr:SDR family oxidoreductase [Gammaproteobacteria bacterium]